MKLVYLLLLIVIWSSTVFSTHVEFSSIPASGDTTFGINWDADTILVTGNLMISSNQHCDITIKAGTVIYFTGMYGIDIYSLTSTFTAAGTPDDSIVFTSPDSIRWKGIRISFSDRDSWKTRNIKFSYCKVERCTTRVVYFEGLDTLSQVELTHNSFIENISATSAICFSALGARIPLFKTLISDNLFIKNTGKNGGAVSVLNTNYDNNKTVNVIIEDNFFSGNRAVTGGAICVEAEKVLIRRNRFENNQAEAGGGALKVNYSPSIIERNVFVHNSVDFPQSNLPGTIGGGALHVLFGMQENDFNEPCVVNNNYFAFNQSPNGGAIHCNDAGTILVNNTICNNRSTNGGGIYLESIKSFVRFYNTIIWGNKLTSGGSNQCFIWNSKPEFYNCAVDGGTSAFIINDTLLAEQNYPGTYTDCFSEYPEFADTVTGDFRLKDNSPCINHGLADTSGLHITMVDLDSHPRIQNGIIDIGCYEVSPVTGIVRLSQGSISASKRKCFSRILNIEKSGSERYSKGYFDLTGRYIDNKKMDKIPSGVHLKKKVFH